MLESPVLEEVVRDDDREDRERGRDDDELRQSRAPEQPGPHPSIVRRAA